MLLEAVSSEEAFITKRTLEFLLMHFTVLFLLLQSIENRWTALTSVNLGGGIEVYWHKHTDRTLFAHPCTLGTGCRCGRGTRIQMN